MRGTEIKTADEAWRRLARSIANRSDPQDDGCRFMRGCAPDEIRYLRVPNVLIRAGWPRNMNAARVACIIFHGQPPRKDSLARHSCGRAACVEEDHLSWGARRVPGQHVDDGLKSAIRRAVMDGGSVGDVAARFGTTATVVMTLVST